MTFAHPTSSAVETAAPWKPWKNPTTIFPPFPPGLENSPLRLRVFHSSHSCCGWIEIYIKTFAKEGYAPFIFPGDYGKLSVPSTPSFPQSQQLKKKSNEKTTTNTAKKCLPCPRTPVYHVPEPNSGRGWREATGEGQPCFSVPQMSNLQTLSLREREKKISIYHVPEHLFTMSPNQTPSRREVGG